MVSRRMGSALCAGVLVLGSGLAGCAAVPVAADAEPIAARVAASDAMLVELVAGDEPGCSAAVAVEGDVVWAGARGLADVEGGIPITTSTRFDIASVSKQFTATAVLLLARDGRLSLEHPVGRYLDGLPEWADDVTLDELLHHTSGVPEFWRELAAEGIGFSDPADQAQTLAAIARETDLEETAGFSYSNSNYVLLAEVVERVSGVPFPRFVGERIFGPAGLDMAVAPASGDPDIARSYDADLELEQPAWTAHGHTGVITTPSELARWGDAYRSGGIVQGDFASGAVDAGDGDRYAAGIRIEADGGLAHLGRWGGHTTFFAVSADRRTTIAVACNGAGADRFGVADALDGIWDGTSDPGATASRR